MASKVKGRWADTEEDAALEAQQKKEREAKKRLKAEKARKLEAERAAREAEAKKAAAATAASASASTANQNPDEADGPPPKRRRLSTEGEAELEVRPPQPRAPAAAAQGGGTRSETSSGGNNLLRFEGGGFGGCRSVENYDKLNDIEEGAYGWVARARELATGKVVALKRLKLDPKDRMGLPVTGLREIQILKDCDHRNVVKMREVVVGDDTSKIENIFLVLEFVEHDLKSLLELMPEPFLASEVKTLLQQLASGIAYLHENWILHRDLKTSNLLLNNRGQLKIADFGMARYVGDPPPANLTQLVVTLWYRAPELLLGARTYDSAIDMWSVGCVFGELLTREPLLQGDTEAEQLVKILDLCGMPTEESWPNFRSLPNSRLVRLPKNAFSNVRYHSAVRARFPFLTAAGVALLDSLLSLDPARRPSARDVLAHEYFRQDPRPKQEAMFPTFPSKAGQERRRRLPTPDAPARGQAVELGQLDFSGVFAGREKEEKGGGFSLRVV